MVSPESDFAVSTIYNETYEDKRGREEDQARRLPGEVYRNDETVITVSLKEGIVIIEHVSGDQMEEDLARMYGRNEQGDFILGAERHKQIFREACLDIVKGCGRYISSEDVENVFPGLDVRDPKSYDFSNARLKFFVLANKDFKDFLVLMGEDNPGEMRTTAGKLYYGSYNISETLKVLKQPVLGLNEERRSRNSLIVTKELHGPKFSQGEFPGNPEELRECEDRLKLIMRHEILHALRPLPHHFPEKTEEGIVNFFARISKSSAEKYYNSYENRVETDTVLGVIRLCEQSGLDVQEVDLALLGQHPESIQKLKDVVVKEMGKDFTKRFFEEGFASYSQMRDARKRLYDLLRSKNNS